MRLNAAMAALLAVSACLSACSQGVPDTAPSAVASAPAVHPVSGLPVVPLTVTSGGKVHRFRVEVASSAEEQAKGLMFRTEMGADEGMIFPEEHPRRAAFWMRNTVIPLDIIYIGTDHRILNIAANAVPYDETPLPSAGLASAVLELNGGRAAELGINPGDTVNWQAVQGSSGKEPR
ncbi:DUF192 domain-containing protein [Novosphingobium beihaiensis]|uniref:DUF192 domain-containing protein n=1 Tax=Novosphingobium beihaiensis TaxID=2930389 RepID=A0ABT0BS32_9SPHN|nr:DUF192 domain-containing protein [Novosphingobium beihaiensis]MCJ2187849.1 DUF192 domain-containing protein [Novosphingobium beihaiensis]